MFEKSVTLDDRSYSFAIDPAGAWLELQPLAHRLPPRPTLAAGTAAPDFTVTTLAGERVTLAGLRGKVVVIDFWATYCPPCVAALPHLAELRARLHARGLELVAIAAAADDVRAVLGDHAAGIEAIDDGVQMAYRVDRFPQYFLISRDGTILCSRCQLPQLEGMLDGAL